MKPQLKKKRSLWKSMSTQSIIILIFIPILGFGLLSCIFPKAMLFVLESLIAIFGLFMIGYWVCRSIRATLIIQSLPISEEELAENHITTKLEYLQALYHALKPYSLDYWYKRFFDDGNKNMSELMEELKRVYYSIKDETTYLPSEKEIDKDAQYIFMFVHNINEYKFHNNIYVRRYKEERAEEAIVLKKEMLEGKEKMVGKRV